MWATSLPSPTSASPMYMDMESPPQCVSRSPVVNNAKDYISTDAEGKNGNGQTGKLGGGDRLVPRRVGQVGSGPRACRAGLSEGVGNGPGGGTSRAFCPSREGRTLALLGWPRATSLLIGRRGARR